MPKMYVNQSNSQRIIEPLFQKNRVKFRNSRISINENVETNLLKLDLTRIESQLDQIDINILKDIKYFGGNIGDVNITTNLNNGLTYELNDVQLYFDDTNDTTSLTVDILSKLGTRLSRLIDKVQRLENG